MRIFIFFIVLFYFQSPILTKSKKIDIHSFMNLSEEEIYPKVSKLTKEETENLISDIRKDARKSYPDIDKFYLLITHLESIKAISEEESRLRSLNFVYILTLALFSILLGFVFFKQRKTVEEVNRLLK